MILGMEPKFHADWSKNRRDRGLWTQGHTVSKARARATDLGVQFICFWVTHGIASRSPFATTDELSLMLNDGIEEAQQIRILTNYDAYPPWLKLKHSLTQICG